MPLSVSLWNDLSDPAFVGVGLTGFKRRANAFLAARSALSFLSPRFYLFLPSMCWLCGVGVFGLIECSHSLPALHCGLQLIIIIIIDAKCGSQNYMVRCQVRITQLHGLVLSGGYPITWLDVKCGYMVRCRVRVTQMHD